MTTCRNCRQEKEERGYFCSKPQCQERKRIAKLDNMKIYRERGGAITTLIKHPYIKSRDINNVYQSYLKADEKKEQKKEG